MKTLLSILSICTLSLGMLTGCGTTNDTNNGGTNNTTNNTTKKKEANKNNGTKKFNAGITQTIMGLKINIGNVNITKTKIEVAMHLENTSKDKLSFFPAQGTAVVGSMQLSSDMFNSDQLTSTGDINAGVKTDGKIVFDVPEGKSLDPNTVKEIDLHLGQLMNNKTFDAKDDVVIKIPVK